MSPEQRLTASRGPYSATPLREIPDAGLREHADALAAKLLAKLARRIDRSKKGDNRFAVARLTEDVLATSKNAAELRAVRAEQRRRAGLPAPVVPSGPEVAPARGKRAGLALALKASRTVGSPEPRTGADGRGDNE